MWHKFAWFLDQNEVKWDALECGDVIWMIRGQVEVFESILQEVEILSPLKFPKTTLNTFDHNLRFKHDMEMP